MQYIVFWLICSVKLLTTVMPFMGHQDLLPCPSASLQEFNQSEAFPKSTLEKEKI